MRRLIFIAFAAGLAAGAAQAAETASPSAAANAAAALQAQLPSSPVEVALVEEKEGWVFRRFPTRHRLYTYDADPAGQSVCVDGCAYRWPPLIAPADAKPVGDWTPIMRTDHRLQWAYKGKPVYARYHDDPDNPGSLGTEPGWRIMPHQTLAQMIAH